MEGACFLWIDLKGSPGDTGLLGELSRRYRIHRIAQPHAVYGAIDHFRPRFLCFDYDIPDYAGLNLLQQTKARYSALPILMFTGQHSESLAIWALRARVWDYFIQPVAVDDVDQSLSSLLRMRMQGSSMRDNLSPVRPPPISNDVGARQRRTSPALRYIEASFSEPITLDRAAGLCHISPSTFSRLFHREHGQTFREFVRDYRIGRAKELLLSSSHSISDIAFAVGFNDLAYFSRAFRRFTGVCPTQFRPASGN